MGLFNSPKIFASSDQIKKAMFQIASLDQKQREIVGQALIKKLDDNGVSAEELKLAIEKLRAAGVISEIDKENLLKLISK